VLVGVQAAGAGPAAGQERFPAGTKDVTIAAGYSVSHNTSPTPNLERVDGFHVIPHFGYFLTGESGEGFLRGNLEGLVEPMLIHLSASKSATVVGLAALGRWVFATGPRVRPYLEAGGGVLGGRVDLRQTDCDLNFMLEAGVGALVFVSDTSALSLGYRFQHISNAGACDKNLGLNSSLVHVGISFFFP
jgi:opacity protein-like surface antigen